LGSSSSERKDNHHILGTALESDLGYCLDALRIKIEDDEATTKIRELYAQNIAFLDIYHKRLVALKIIADYVTLASNFLSQSQLYDFLMLSSAAVSAEEMRGHERPVGTDDMIFKIYRDLMENYETANDVLKLNYPRIIVDAFAVLSNGSDMDGKEVSVYRAYDYYLLRKSEPVSNDIAEVYSSKIISDEDKYGADHDISRSNNDLIQSLVRITGRNSKQIETLLTRLNRSDIERIRNLCVNYPKIDKYCRLVTYDRKHFVEEIEREQSGKKLTKAQQQIAVISIKKVQEYIENVLDRKFVPHSSHYINHTKHNLEYGYQVMGLIDSGKRKPKEERSSSRNSKR
jgi:hypothetical protein